MSEFLSELGGLTAGAGAEALAFAAGFAAARALAPAATTISQDAWNVAPVKRLDAFSAAEAAAQQPDDHDTLTTEARYSGFDSSRFAYLYNLRLTAPGDGTLLRALRRGTISPDDFTHGLRKHSLETRWDAPLLDLEHEKLDPVQLANAIHRGLIPDPGLLAVPPPSGTGNVPAYPVYDIPALPEARAAGIDHDRLGVLVGLMGLPMGPHEAAQAVFRGILTDTDYQRAIAEGNTRNEWGAAIMEQTRQIPTARDFFENALRGYHDLAWAQDQAKRHGMSSADSLVIYQNQGRPMALTNITKALARGGTFHPEPGEITDPYTASIVEGNLKPGYYDFGHHLIYQYPSAFVFRQLAQSGALGGQPEVKQWLLELAWPPQLADLAATAWTTVGAASDSHAGKAQTQLWNTVHTSYKNGEIDQATAEAALPSAGVPSATIADVLNVWNAERTLIRKQLSPTQIRKAVSGGVTNPATGTAWTHADATAALLARGYSPDDAETFLAE